MQSLYISWMVLVQEVVAFYNVKKRLLAGGSILAVELLSRGEHREHNPRSFTSNHKRHKRRNLKTRAADRTINRPQGKTQVKEAIKIPAEFTVVAPGQARVKTLLTRRDRVMMPYD